jgi:molybdopterin-guanine dinucleotide biosynthesis protein A
MVMRSAAEQFERRHGSQPLEAVLARLGREHDLLLVEGHKQTDLPKFWLHGEGAGGREIPDETGNIVAVLERDCDRTAALLAHLEHWLPQAWRERPLWGGVMVGGASRRMGSPKQLLEFHGRTLGERAAAALGSALGPERVAVLGAGELAGAIRPLPRLADVPGMAGPGAALAAAHRWQPEAGWILAACDHPWLAAGQMEWLHAQRRPGCWAVLPLQADAHPCPTLALYEPQALALLETLRLGGAVADGRPTALLGLPQTQTPEPPAELAAGWRSVNTPAELEAERARQ